MPIRGARCRLRVFRKVVAEALGPHRHLSPHCLRHTWASLHMARGTPLKWIQDQGGWSTAKVLLDTYGHFMPSESRGFADVIAAENGSGTAPTESAEFTRSAIGGESDGSPAGYADEESPTTPRSPIMHLDRWLKKIG